MKVVIVILVIICTSCARDNWRQQYSGNENDCREITPEMIEILTNPDKKINKDEEK
jgi:hypothetical protein